MNTLPKPSIRGWGWNSRTVGTVVGGQKFSGIADRCPDSGLAISRAPMFIEALPRNATGKIMKLELRERANG